jgi:hypothetical protein
MTRPPVVLLGPQRTNPIVIDAIEGLGVSGTIGVVTAGWEERELEVEELAEHLGRDVVNLRVHARAEEVFTRDPELKDAVVARKGLRRGLQELYQLQLHAALGAAREVFERERPRAVPPEVFEEILEGAVEAVRQLDARHLEAKRAAMTEFDERWRPAERDAVAAMRAEVASELEGVSALCIAGGHVAVLTNRLRLLDVLGAAEHLPVVAWSAGAMALTERIVLFHDSPPQGPGDAEVLGPGLGIVQGVVALPHARRRLQLDDPLRVSILARRLAPARCIALDEGSRVVLDGSAEPAATSARHLRADGAVAEEAAA